MFCASGKKRVVVLISLSILLLIIGNLLYFKGKSIVDFSDFIEGFMLGIGIVFMIVWIIVMTIYIGSKKADKSEK